LVFRIVPALIQPFFSKTKKQKFKTGRMFHPILPVTGGYWFFLVVINTHPTIFQKQKTK